MGVIWLSVLGAPVEIGCRLPTEALSTCRLSARGG
jgi:hypothetical protein